MSEAELVAETEQAALVPATETDALVVFAGAPGDAVVQMTTIANVLDGIIRARNLAVDIRGQKHLRVEAWCALGSMVGVSSRTVWTKTVSEQPYGCLARVEVVRVKTGDVVGAAEAACFADERAGGKLRWMDGDAPSRHAIISMAQTRATSKALGQVLRYIPVLAGYAGTPAEEMSPDGYDRPILPSEFQTPRQQAQQGKRYYEPTACPKCGKKDTVGFAKAKNKFFCRARPWNDKPAGCGHEWPKGREPGSDDEEHPAVGIVKEAFGVPKTEQMVVRFKERMDEMAYMRNPLAFPPIGTDIAKAIEKGELGPAEREELMKYYTTRLEEARKGE